MEIFTLILLIDSGSVRFSRTLGSEFGRTELTFEMCRTEPNCSAEKFGRTKRTMGPKHMPGGQRKIQIF